MAPLTPIQPPKPQEPLLLTVLGPAGERRRVHVDRSPFRIGRLPDRELSLKDARISRNHAQILREDGRYFVEDVESRHGVFVNGTKVDGAADARDGDEIGVGESKLLFTTRDFPDRESALKDQHLKRWFGEDIRRTMI